MLTITDLLILVAIPAATVAIWTYRDTRRVRRNHAADPRNERWLCENLDCTRHWRHRGVCNQEGSR